MSNLLHRPAMTDVQWYVEDADDMRTWRIPSTTLDGLTAARELGEAWWHRSGDYCAEFELTIVTPPRFAGRYYFTVESEPVFYVREIKP